MKAPYLKNYNFFKAPNNHATCPHAIGSIHSLGKRYFIFSLCIFSEGAHTFFRKPFFMLQKANFVQFIRGNFYLLLKFGGHLPKGFFTCSHVVKVSKVYKNEFFWLILTNEQLREKLHINSFWIDFGEEKIIREER